MPYRTFDDRIDGLVITFFNITDLKQMEDELHEKEQVHHLILNTSSDIIVKIAPDWKILEFNPQAEKFFGKKLKNVLNKNFVQLFVPEEKNKSTEKDLKKLMKEGFDATFKMQLIESKGNRTTVEWSANILMNSLGNATEMILMTKNTLNHE
jgi:two-component system CheB/CheR fusion protein